MEEWKSIKGYEGLYEVSNLGNVKSLGRKIQLPNGGVYWKPIKILKQNTDKCGYKYVSLTDAIGRLKSKKVHQLVATAFIENANNYNQINHIDEDKTNNCVNNLEWCTIEYNNRYGTRCKRISESRIGIGKGRRLSEETRLKMSESHKRILGRPVSDSTRKKISESLKKYYEGKNF